MGWQNVFAAFFEAGDTIILNSLGLLVYNGTPGPGTLAGSISVSSVNTEPDGFGNTIQPGISEYGPNGSFISVAANSNGGYIQFQPAGATQDTVRPEIISGAINGGAANEFVGLVMSSGKENGLADAAVQLFSESADTTIAPRIVFEFGGTVFAQIQQQGLVLFGLGGTPPASSGNASIFSTSSGDLSVVSGADSEAYQTERRSLFLSAGTGAITGTTPQGIGLSTAVAAKSYRVSGVLFVTAGSATTLAFDMVAPASSTGQFAISVQRAAVLLGTSAIGVNGGAVGVGTALVNGNVYVVYIDGIVSAAAAGTFSVEMCNVAAGNSFAVDPNSYIDVMPV
jgi:hypothetical protein